MMPEVLKYKMMLGESKTLPIDFDLLDNGFRDNDLCVYYIKY